MTLKNAFGITPIALALSSLNPALGQNVNMDEYIEFLDQVKLEGSTCSEDSKKIVFVREIPRKNNLQYSPEEIDKLQENQIESYRVAEVLARLNVKDFIIEGITPQDLNLTYEELFVRQILENLDPDNKRFIQDVKSLSSTNKLLLENEIVSKQEYTNTQEKLDNIVQNITNTYSFLGGGALNWARQDNNITVLPGDTPITKIENVLDRFQLLDYKIKFALNKCESNSQNQTCINLENKISNHENIIYNKNKARMDLVLTLAQIHDKPTAIFYDGELNFKDAIYQWNKNDIGKPFCLTQITTPSYE